MIEKKFRKRIRKKVDNRQIFLVVDRNKNKNQLFPSTGRFSKMGDHSPDVNIAALETGKYFFLEFIFL